MIKDIFVGGNGGWLGVVARVGLPVVLALGLTGFLVTNVSSAQTTIMNNQAVIIKNQDALLNSMNTAMDRMSRFVESTTREGEMRTRLLLQTCLNTSNTEAARQVCLAAVR